MRLQEYRYLTKSIITINDFSLQNYSEMELDLQILNKNTILAIRTDLDGKHYIHRWMYSFGHLMSNKNMELETINNGNYRNQRVCKIIGVDDLT